MQKQSQTNPKPTSVMHCAASNFPLLPYAAQLWQLNLKLQTFTRVLQTAQRRFLSILRRSRAHRGDWDQPQPQSNEKEITEIHLRDKVWYRSKGWHRAWVHSTACSETRSCWGGNAEHFCTWLSMEQQPQVPRVVTGLGGGGCWLLNGSRG